MTTENLEVALECIEKRLKEHNVQMCILNETLKQIAEKGIMAEVKR